MKRTKRLASILLALVMVFALTATAFAAGTNSITVKNVKAGETYKIYKMLDLVVDESATNYSYTINSAWNAFFTGEGAGAAYITVDALGYVSWNAEKDGQTEAFAKAAAAYAADKSALHAETPTADGDYTFTELEAGYYLITSTNGTLAMVDTTPDNVAVEVIEKNPDPSLTKEVQEDSTLAWGEENSAQIGDVVNFRTEITLQKGARNYVMHDVMDSGLTFDANSVTIAGLTADVDYTVNTATTDGCTFEVVFAQSYLDKVDGVKVLTVNYSATLNSSATVETNQLNKAKITWGDNGKTEFDTTITKTYQFTVLKYDKADAEKNALAGATFQLKKGGTVLNLVKISDTKYRIATATDTDTVDSFTTVSDGKITIYGVDLDSDYELEETAAPEGYNRLGESVKVDMSTGAETNIEIEVANSSGNELPETGGRGTTMLYVLGFILVAGAAVLLITKKRMSVEK